MLRHRLLAPIAGLATTLVVGPLLAGPVLSADPTVVVRPGDTLTSIARRHDVSIATLVGLNHLTNPNRIYAGQRLSIAATAPAARPAAAAPAKPTTGGTHTVKRGEHLTGIARRYGVTVAAIVRTNSIANPSRIYAGQRLVIPGSAPATAKPKPAPKPAAPAPPAPKPAAARVHHVAAGQNLTGIARRYGVTVAALAAANRITDPSRIFAGQRLTIPGKSVVAASPPASSMPSSMAALVAKRDAVRRVIVEEANRYHVPPAFALAVAWQESGWQQRVVSHAGAVGVMQLMPATAEWVGEVMLGTRVNLHDTRQNVRAGVRLLAHYLNRYDGDRDRVLAAYYQGQTATDRHGIYNVSRPYIASIKVLERMFAR